jgi:hypothetical protein
LETKDITCVKCGWADDWMLAYVETKICWTCLREIHKEVTKDMYN